MCTLISVHSGDDWRKYFGSAGVGHKAAMERMKARQPHFDAIIAAVREEMIGVEGVHTAIMGNFDCTPDVITNLKELIDGVVD